MRSQMSLSKLRSNMPRWAGQSFPANLPTSHRSLSHGVKDATTDPKQIKAWWTLHPDAMIGLATGSASDLLVLDVDVDTSKGVDGEVSLKALSNGASLPARSDGGQNTARRAAPVFHHAARHEDWQFGWQARSRSRYPRWRRLCDLRAIDQQRRHRLSMGAVGRALLAARLAA